MTVEQMETTVANRIMELADEILSSHGDFSPDAVKELTRKVSKDKELVKQLVHTACYDALRMAARRLRRRIDRESHIPKTYSPEFVSAVQEASKGFYDWPLPIKNGLRLGLATKEDLEAAAAFHEKNRDSHEREYRWYRLISNQLQPGEAVESRLSLKQLSSLRTKAEKSK